MAISAADVKKLRDKTDVGMMDCKKALEETGGNFDKAVELLRKKGMQVANKRAGREASEGMVDAYIHMGGKMGVLVEVNCESDFVAKSDNFKAFVKDVSMHIAASDTQYVSRDQVPAEVVEKEKSILKEQALASGKPENIVDKMVEGRINKFFEERCLLDQPFVKDPDKSIQQLLDDLMGKTGEKCQIRRFAKFQLGEEI